MTAPNRFFQLKTVQVSSRFCESRHVRSRPTQAHVPHTNEHKAECYDYFDPVYTDLQWETPGTPQSPRRVALGVYLYVAEVVGCSGNFPCCQKATFELTKVNTLHLEEIRNRSI
ncbi:hypothetical protein SCLCIDRAFT_246795 [Scleroderma citrinum Foug A]|uniref:Uncharacterized protein n=1 Tax=Scleroderma citrinum Foug A TaxID=1036808 RepID=A0A0C3DJN9_9AGAM|nr:hypothetical protein SCLCIDRAFT_246795 [Scleroderma citrinum Foug A]